MNSEKMNSDEKTNDLTERSDFGNEHVGWFRKVFTAMRQALLPESSVEDDSLWVMFRSDEDKAMKIAEEVSNEIEICFSRNSGEEFLNAYDTLCRACTPDCIDKIIRMMFKKPVYFEKGLGSDVIGWVASLPTSSDTPFEVAADPIKVEYLNKFYTKASLLTQDGPYISATFTTSRDAKKGCRGDMSLTTGLFEIYTAADTIFNMEWDIPGVIRYSATVSVMHATGTGIGSHQHLLMEIIRACVEDLVCSELWSGYFGEYRPQSDKRHRPYYRVALGFLHQEFPKSVDSMVKTDAHNTVASTVKYSASIKYNQEGVPLDSNFKISGDRTEECQQEGRSFTITVYPPLEDRPRRPPVNTMVDVCHKDDECIIQSIGTDEERSTCVGEN